MASAGSARTVPARFDGIRGACGGAIVYDASANDADGPIHRVRRPGGRGPGVKTLVEGLVRNRSGDFLDFTVADAGCAGAKTLVGSVDDRSHGLNIDVPAAVGH